MIWESRYWKADLIRAAVRIRAQCQKPSLPDSAYARVEKDIMIGFYSIRKLAQAHKLSDAVANSGFRVATFSSKRESHMTFINKSDLGRHFDLASRTPQRVKLPFICNQIIHSYVFEVGTTGAGALRSFFFTSDRHRRKRLYQMTARMVATLFEKVGRDFPSHSRMRFDKGVGDFVVRQWTSKEWRV